MRQNTEKTSSWCLLSLATAFPAAEAFRSLLASSSSSSATHRQVVNWNIGKPRLANLLEKAKHKYGDPQVPTFNQLNRHQNNTTGPSQLHISKTTTTISCIVVELSLRCNYGNVKRQRNNTTTTPQQLWTCLEQLYCRCVVVVMPIESRKGWHLCATVLETVWLSVNIQNILYTDFNEPPRNDSPWAEKN